ncbi:MAG TPA: DinB family protein [Saprospiraceae bacterium]|nr:DinB family protein [Saprospiraceae bacterium]HMQ83147.1 DinB family protein [Saprospiraceae bacterium]
MDTRAVIENRLSGQHEVGMTIMLDTPDSILSRRPASDKWSVFEHFAHLVRYQHLFIQKVDRILTELNPSIPRYAAENDAAFKSWLQNDKEWQIHQLINDRFAVYNQFLEFTDQILKKPGTHPVYGRLTLMEWHEFFVLHEAHHLHAMWKMSKMTL